jgi:hypothetical protein
MLLPIRSSSSFSLAASIARRQCRRRRSLFSLHYERTTLPPPLAASTSASFLPTSSSALFSSKSGGSADESGGGSFFDDYDDFVENLNFEDGGWDDGGAAAVAATSSNGNDSHRGGDKGRGRGGDRRSRDNYGNYGGGYADGHDYSRDTTRDDASIPADKMSVINELLSSRLDARRSRNFDEADAIRETLTNDHGVSVWDKDKTWSTGGGSTGGGGSSSSRFDPSRGDRRGGSGREGRGSGGGGEGRGSGRGRGRVRSFNEYGHDYAQVSGTIVNPNTCSLSESEIHDLIKRRMESKFARRFNIADRIEQDLRNAGVNVNDGTKEWRADGQDFFQRGERGGGGREQRRGGDRQDWDNTGPKPPRVYRQRGHGNGLTPEQISTISEMVAERSVAKSIVDYDRADEIYAELTAKYNVNIDDRAGEWALLSEEYMFNEAESSFIPEETIIAAIGKRLGDRILARKRRDFDMADDIRDELRNDYVVEIDDGNKEWMIVSPRGAMWDTNDDNENGGGMNVVSKEEWDAEDNANDDDDDDDKYMEQDNIDVAFDDFMINDSAKEVDNEIILAVGTDDVASTLSTLTVPELKDRLKELGLGVSGKKSELIARLIDAASE